MIGMVLVTHGNLADEFVLAMQHVVGRQDAIKTVCIGPNDDMERRRDEIARHTTARHGHLATRGAGARKRQRNGSSRVSWLLLQEAGVAKTRGAEFRAGSARHY